MNLPEYSRSTDFSAPSLPVDERMVQEALEEVREALELSELVIQGESREVLSDFAWEQSAPVEENLPSPPLTYTPSPGETSPSNSDEKWLKLVTGTAAVGLAVFLGMGNHEKGAEIASPPALPQPELKSERREPPKDEAKELLAAIAQGQARLSVMGNEAFQKRTMEALGKIATLPEGIKLLKEIESNPKGKKVFVKYGAEPGAGDCARVPSLPCGKGDIVVEISELRIPGLIDGKFEFVLAHELDHARRFLLGKDAGEQKAINPGFPNREEELAVEFENVIRKGLNAPLRKFYYHSKAEIERY